MTVSAQEAVFEKAVSMVLFRALELSMAVPYEYIREVLASAEPEFVPGLPPYMKGMLNYYGQICPIVSFNNSSEDRKPAVYGKSSILMLASPENGSVIIGVLVESFSGSAKILSGEVRPITVLPGGFSHGCFAGEITIKGDRTYILNPFEFLKTLDYISLK